jgi:hypothetical protein
VGEGIVMGITAFPRTARLVNRFSLGSDPEFVLNSSTGKYIHAESCGLLTSRAFGSDMAGRQAEIRAYPSKFALEVVASIVDSLRWMAYVHRYDISQLTWSAISYNGKDGCGGHIHLGRRRPDRQKDVEILDTTCQTLINQGVFNKHTFNMRVVNTHYGKYGDIRPQSHGYEYRTLPTQMASPWLMYFVLVLNKLLLYHGGKWRLDISMLFKMYQDKDDDAAIALQALQKWGLPSEDTTDFRGRWGVENFTKAPTDFSFNQFGNCFFPSMIKPEEQTCHELFEYLTQGTPMLKRTPQPTWEPFQLPKGFYNLTAQQHTLGHLPDVVKDLISKGRRVQLMVTEYFLVYHDVPLPIQGIKQALRSSIDVIVFHRTTSGGIQIGIPSEFNKSLAQCKMLHNVLSNTDLFPVCKAVDYKTVDWSRWDSPSVSTPKAPLGRLRDHLVGKPPKTEIEPAIKPAVRKQAPYPREEW